MTGVQTCALPISICGFLEFLKAFKFNSSEFWDLGRWFGWFLFECSLHSKLKLEASKLGSNIVSGLLNLDLLQLFSFSPSLASLWNVLGRLLFIGVRGWVSDTWQILIGDTCHSLISSLMSLLTRAKIACVIAYTCEVACAIAYTCVDAWLVFAWHLANFRWLLNSDSKI